MRTQTKKLRS